MEFKKEELVVIVIVCIIVVLLLICFCAIFYICRRKRHGYVRLQESYSMRGSQINVMVAQTLSKEKLDPTTETLLKSAEVPKEQKRREIEKIKTKKRQKEVEEIQLDGNFYLRSTPNYLNAEYHPDIGGRAGKNYFLVDEKGTGLKRMLAMTTAGSLFATKLTSDSRIDVLKTIIKKIQHPFIVSTLFVDFRKDKGCLVVVREFFPKGTLRDLIHTSKPLDFYNFKYGQLTGKPLSEKKIRLFGHQILEAMDYLLDQGLPCYHVHSGNVILDNGTCKLIDFENDYLGIVPKTHSVMRPLLDKVDPAIVAFGSLLYEMTVGYPMDSAILDDIPLSSNPKAVKVLKKIFDTSARETVQTIVKDPFFSDVKLYSDWKTSEISFDKREKKIVEAVSKLTIDALKEAPTSPSRSAPAQAATKKKAKQKKAPETSAPVSSVSSAPSAPAPPPPSSSAPAPPPPPPPSSAPPPPPASVPPSNPGRAALLESIRNPENMKKLKKVET